MEKLNRLSTSGMTVANPDEDIRGRTVLDKDGQKLGTVHDLFLDAAERKVRFLLVTHGGILGIHRAETLIPVDAVTSITGNDVHADQTLAHVAKAPAYDPDLVNELHYYGGLYNHFDYIPFWTHGYKYPGYPHYG